MNAQLRAQCFQIHATDNVATLLQDIDTGAEVQVRGELAPYEVRAADAIKIGHKIALQPMTAGTPIVKYGFPIGEATQSIAQGAWVHLHNCRSFYDALSSELDLDSGSRKETRYV
jgi:altronate dehydratase small subunit